MGKKQVAFLMGPGHCGSTLVELFLGSHSKVMALGELSSLRTSLSDPGSTIKCNFCQDNCPYWHHKIELSVLRRYLGKKHKIVDSFRSRFEKSLHFYLSERFGSDILIDSSKSVAWIAAQISQSQPGKNIQPILLYVVRDGRAVVNSYLRKYPERGIEGVTLEWKHKIEEMNAYYRAFAFKKYIVRYENLVLEPVRILRELCELLDIPFEAKMQDYWASDHHTIAGNAGTRLMVEKYRALSSQNPADIAPTGHSWHKSYYDKLPVGIYLDLRWKEELSAENQQYFASLAGELNRPFEYNES
jgi:hypothetical protein